MAGKGKKLTFLLVHGRTIMWSGPLFFNIYINNLFSLFVNKSDTAPYVYDSYLATLLNLEYDTLSAIIWFE